MARLMWAINDLQDGKAIFATTKMELSFFPSSVAVFPKEDQCEYGVHESWRNFLNILRMITKMSTTWSDWTHLGKEGGDNNECLVDTRQRH